MAVDWLSNRAVFTPGGNPEEFCQARLVELTRGTIAIGLNPFGMFPAQCFVDLLLKLNVCVVWVRNG